LHVGGIRTALFAWLVARQNNGKFILRLEDTDRARYVEGSEQHIIDSLKALGIDYDEGIGKEGEYGPYRQSERLEHYKKWAQKLIDAGRAYADPYTPEEVQAFREQAQREKKPFKFREHRPEDLPKWDGTRPLRFVSSNDPNKPRSYRDAVMGGVLVHWDASDDFILVKADGYPTYNFAHIVDDAEMKITHVIRGQEFLSSMGSYLDLYDALDIEPPIIATVPHILGPDGKKKLSKRDGAKDVLDYVREGYLPEALVSFIATLGWNDGTEQEIFTKDELLQKFSLDRVQRSGAKFDEQRLTWINGHFIRNMDPDELYKRAADFWPVEAREEEGDYKKAVLKLVSERLKFFSEVPELTKFFFTDLPVDPSLIENNKQLKKFSKDELKQLLQAAKSDLEQSDFSLDDLTKRLNKLLEKTGQKPAVLFSLIRIATTQVPASPGLAETLNILGKERSLRRIEQQLTSWN
jgi:glutamyl-tRNA synthetase